MTEITTLVKSSVAESSISEWLDAPIGILNGANDASVAALKPLGIETVRDLASSPHFSTALAIVGASRGAGRIPRHRVHRDAQGVPPAELVTMPATAIAGIGQDHARDLQAALAIGSVRDMGYHPLYQAARAIREALTGSVAADLGATVDDPEAPAELVPTANRYPTEKRYYSRIFIDRIDPEPTPTAHMPTGRPRHPELSPIDGPIPMESAEGVGSLFRQPAMGALLQFEQAWHPQGVSLGHLLHSLALAPGENTRIAVVDWSRSSSAGVTEEVSQIESVASETTQARAIEEIAQGVASEVQYGQSESSAESVTRRGGVSAGFVAKGFGIGASYSSAKTRSHGISVSSSGGSRNVTAQSLQNIQNSTQQHASSARTRRAAVIKETTQGENERMQTRVVANYNHSHALSVQYYEVVQIYRVVVSVAKVERVIFVPLAPLDFKGRGVVDKHRAALLDAALDPYAASLLARRARGVSAGTDVHAALALPRRADELVAKLTDADVPLQLKSQGKGLDEFRKAERAAYVNGEMVRYARLKDEETDGYRHLGVTGDGTAGRWEIPVEAELCGVRVEPGDTTGTYGDLGFSALELYGSGERALGVIDVGTSGANQVVHFVDRAVPVSLLSHVDLRRTGEVARGTVYLYFRLNGEEFFIAFEADWGKATPTIRLLTLKQPQMAAEAGSVLNRDRLYYSQAVWNSLDEQTVALLLAGYTYRGRRLVECVDPQPVSVYGNYLVLRYTHEDDATREEWVQWQRRHLDHGRREEALIPVATGGVFAEAVLGRFNASEKIDMTRFWNWQDSPIPLLASDIAPLQAGGRSETDAIVPGRLDAPVVNITNPAPLPDPMGMGGVFATLSAANLFRDMSGLGGTQSLAQSAMSTSAASADAAANAALGAMAQVASVRRAEAARDGISGSANTHASKMGPGNPTYVGGMLNAGRALDDQRVGTSRALGSGGGGGGASVGVSSPAAGRGGSNAERAFMNAIGATPASDVSAGAPDGGGDGGAGSSTAEGEGSEQTEGDTPQSFEEWLEERTGGLVMLATNNDGGEIATVRTLPTDFQAKPTVFKGGFERLRLCLEACRDNNTGGFAGGIVQDVEGWGALSKSTVTNCSPLTATVVSMMLHPLAGGTSAAELAAVTSPDLRYTPRFTGWDPATNAQDPIGLPFSFYRLHNGNYLPPQPQRPRSPSPNATPAEVARYEDSQRRYQEALAAHPELLRRETASLQAVLDQLDDESPLVRAYPSVGARFANRSAGSLMLFNLGYEIDPKDMRRGDWVGIHWSWNGQHSVFCWDVHLDGNGAVDCFQFAGANSFGSGGPGVTLGARDYSKFVAQDRVSREWHKVPARDPLFVDRVENVTEATWYCRNGVAPGAIDTTSFIAEVQRRTFDTRIVGLRVVRFWGVGPPTRNQDHVPDAITHDATYRRGDFQANFAMASALAIEDPPAPYAWQAASLVPPSP